MSDLQHPKIDEAKLRLPMPGLLKHLELGAHVNTRANTQCPLCHRENAFALREDSGGNWFFECCVCGSGDEIMFLHKHLKITRFNAATRYLQMAGVLDAPQKSKNTPVPHVQSGNGAPSVNGSAAKRPTEKAALQGSAIMETQSPANVGARNATVADQKHTVQQGSYYRHMEAIGRGESLRTGKGSEQFNEPPVVTEYMP